MRASGNGVIVVDVTAVRVAIIPVFKSHEGGWWAGVGIVATAATVAAATAAATVVVSDGVGIFAADVVICATTGIVGAPPPQYPCICCWPQHPRSTCAAFLALLLLWRVLDRSGGGAGCRWHCRASGFIAACC